VGLTHPDDAGVYRISDDVALVQTVDFFTPIVDDPVWFGRIAAANALSDIYAMGGVPKTAMNIVCFPIKKMDRQILKEILSGGLDKLREASTVLVGGHSVEDDEIKYGLSITGIVHPQKFLTKEGLAAGDELLLTKPLGTGVISTALKAGFAKDEHVQIMLESMAALNKAASEIMMASRASACTDITGFSLLGHAFEMIRGKELGIIFDSGQIPVLPGAFEYASMGLVPGGTGRNRDYFGKWVKIEKEISKELIDLFYDPQTSGGLLIAVDRENSGELKQKLLKKGIEAVRSIGIVTSDLKEQIIIR
jgi:selenide,water dikinase